MMWGEKCDRCQKGDENRYKDTSRAAGASLLGGFNALLCPECRNDWHDQIVDTEPFNIIKASEATIAAFQGTGEVDESRIIIAQNNAHEASMRLFEMGRNFVAEDAECRHATLSES